MIIGNGDIASVIPDKEGFVFFASGVSDSSSVDEEQYQREIDLILKQPKDQHIVYFSSLAVFNGKKSRYLYHKREMEAIVRLNFPAFTIFRLGNITWGTNPHTLINYLKSHPNAPIKEEYRYICDKDEFLYWVKRIPNWSCEMNVPGERMHVRDVYRRYVKPYNNLSHAK